jgi:hypothetical protein
MEQPDGHELDEWGRWSPQFTSTDGDLQLGLIDPQTQAAPQGSVQKNPTSRLPTSYSLGQKARPIGDLILTFTVGLVFAILYILFINYVLIWGTVQVGSVFFNAPTANLLVSIFSQISATLSYMMVHGLFGALRLAFAARKGGILAPTFLGLGPAASWLEVLKSAFVDRLFNLWCDFRYVFFEVAEYELLLS